MSMLKQVVKDRLAAPKTSNENEDFLDSVIKDIGIEKLVTEEFIVHLLFALLIASYDSVSLTLAVAFKLLSEHPSVLEELIVSAENRYKFVISTFFFLIFVWFRMNMKL